jgi:hypothetical protein
MERDWVWVPVTEPEAGEDKMIQDCRVEADQLSVPPPVFEMVTDCAAVGAFDPGVAVKLRLCVESVRAGGRITVNEMLTGCEEGVAVGEAMITVPEYGPGFRVLLATWM